MVRKQLSMGISLSDIKLRVTDYARVSTDHIEQKKSLQNQVEHFSKYIKDNKNWIYVPGYVDEGITGTSDIKRDNFMRMIDDARRGKFDLIITKEISRFSRNTLDSIRYTRELLGYGVAVLFVNDNINTALPDSELRLTIMASMAQDEVRRLSERVKFGMNRAIERGDILGNDMFYGYKKNKDNGRLEIVEEEAIIVRRIYELYVVKEMSLSKISKILNKEELKTSRGNKWSVSTISRMIENPKYKGYYCGKKSEVVDYMSKKIKYFDSDDWIMYEDREKVPPIVLEELWEMANARLVKRKKDFKVRNKKKDIYKNRYLYSAKIWCGVHDKVFHRREFRRNKKDSTWVCSEYLRKGRMYCDSPKVREQELGFIMGDLIKELDVSLDGVSSILMEYYDKDDVLDDVNDKIRRLNEDKDIVIKKKRKLLELRLEDKVDDLEFQDSNKEFKEKIRDISRDLVMLENILRDKENNEDIDKVLREEILTKLKSSGVRDKIIDKLLNKIVVNKNCQNVIELDIFFNYNGNKDSDVKEYQFKRGYDTRSTKRYIIFYKVRYYFLEK